MTDKLPDDDPEEETPKEDDLPSKPEVVRTTIEFKRPWLYEKQFAAIYDPRRYSLIEASTKAGKTLGCIIWEVEKALFGGGQSRNYWWVAPVSLQADMAFDRMARYLPEGTFTALKNPRRIILLNGAVIWFKSGDHPDALYGEDVHAAVIDEASRLKEAAWEAVRTTLVATRGPCRIIGNVKGRKNWFYRMARRAEQNGDDMSQDMGYHKITAYDAVQAGVLSADEIEEARTSGQLTEAAFRELFLAEPSADEGNPFGGSTHINACIGPLSTGKAVRWGWDLGKHQDYTVGIGLDSSGQVCRFERFQSLPWDDIMNRMVAVTGNTPALVDSTGLGDPVLDMLQKRPGTRFEGYQFNQGSKQKLMEGLAVAIQSRAVTYPDGQIVRELESFEYIFTRTGVRYSAPEGLFDDCVCALALAVIHKQMKPNHPRITQADVQAVIRRGQLRRIDW